MSTQTRFSSPARWSFIRRLVIGLLVLNGHALGGATISLVPVPPKTVPASNYPPGTTISGTTITLGSVPACVWLELHVTGWAPQELKTVQIKIDASGYLGTNAVCPNSPTPGADIVRASQACFANLDCRSQIAGLAQPCALGEPSTCTGGMCQPGFQNFCNPSWIAPGRGFMVTDYFGPCFASPYCTFGMTSDPGDPLVDHSPSYVGTLVLDVPPGTKGTYTIGFIEPETFLQDQTTPVAQNIPLEALNPAVIVVPCGRCCFGYGSDPVYCTEGVSAEECADLAPNNHFAADEVCPENGGPDCPDCATYADCDDGLACTLDGCVLPAGQCQFTPTNALCDDGVFCNGVETCDPAAGCVPGVAPCAPGPFPCDEDRDRCPSSEIPTVGTWGLLILALVLATTAKLRFRNRIAAA